jgi:TolB-like protein/class 3 adenylate cyclase/cytochrome c-type biogenesis protein CcmH/NrfG
VERRLAAILCADAVGYSRVMAEDEEGTARTLAACRHLISDLVGQRGGRVVDAPGDNVLAEFPSVVNAVRCAVGIQEELERRMAELPEARRLLFRIGVHLGDVLVEGDRILGDGVNVAARLESLAEPGGICISGTAFDQVEGKLDLTFENTGEQAVKNIPKPVRTYRIGMRPTARGPRALRARRGVPRRVPRTRLAVLVGLVLLALWFLASPPSFLDPGLSRRSDDEKSIAVLPFANMSGDAANEPFTIGIHDDLLSHLSRIGSLKTISRTSVLQYRDTTKTIPEIAGELGVATILEGGVQRAGDRVRINVQLIDAATDEHLWAGTYERQLTAANIFAIQSEIATAIAEALQVTLSPEEQQRIESAPTQNLAAVETYFLGKQLLERRTTESLSAAVEYFQQVIELDPNFALAHSGLADAYMLLPEYTASIDPKVAQEKSEAAATRALALDPDLPEVLSSMGWNRLIHYYDWQGAEALLRRAVAVEANNTNALHWLSHVLSWQGRHAEATEAARRAVDVDPLSRLMAMNLSYILMDAGDFDEAIALAHATVARFPDHPEQLGNLWLTYLRAGRPEEAADTIQQWANATGRDVQAAREVGEAFIRHGRTGEQQQLSRELLARLNVTSDDLGVIYAFVGNGEGALDALERAYEERSGSRSVLSMKLNPGYEFIRDDPRFVELMKRVGLEL